MAQSLGVQGMWARVVWIGLVSRRLRWHSIQISRVAPRLLLELLYLHYNLSLFFDATRHPIQIAPLLTPT